MRKELVVRLFVAAITFMAIAILNPFIASAECDPSACDAGKKCVWLLGEKSCRQPCCGSDTSKCSGDEVCFGGYCVSTEEAQKLKDRAVAGARKKAEKEKAESDEARKKAEKEKAESDKARKKAEKEKAESDEARKKAEKERAESDEARKKAEQHGDWDANIYAMLVVSGIPEGHPVDSVLTRVWATVGWHPAIAGDWFRLGPELGAGWEGIPGPEYSVAYDVTVGATALIIPAEWIDLKVGLLYTAITPRFREDGGTDARGTVLLAARFKWPYFDIGIAFMEELGAELLNTCPGYLGGTFSGRW